jgi:nitrogen fixation protein NifX
MPTDDGVYRIAIASTDGKVVNEHFGRASFFYIAEIKSDGTYSVTCKRDVIPLCDSGEHTEEGILTKVKELGDCTAVLVAKIGNPVERAFEINGISVFEQPDFIEDALVKLAKYYTGNIKHEEKKE